MNIPLRIIKPPGGEMYPYPVSDDFTPGDMWATDAGWAIVLPNRTVFFTHVKSATGDRWQISGTAPGLTVTPSIDDQNPERPWHGWIRDGELVNA